MRFRVPPLELESLESPSEEDDVSDSELDEDAKYPAAGPGRASRSMMCCGVDS